MEKGFWASIGFVVGVDVERLFNVTTFSETAYLLASSAIVIGILYWQCRKFREEAKGV